MQPTPSNGAITTRAERVPALAMDEAELISVLESSLYPGAKPESIKLVISYCRAAGLDPIQKPVHIVPMSVKKGDGYEWRDVVMPGIGLYRTKAARTGQHAGTSEPEFGPDVTTKLGGVEITFPSWCRVVVRRRLPSGEHAEFAAVERWLENYATAKRDSEAPNAMWRKRPYAQLAKCAEAQALRKAFPEIGSEATADEMAGKVIDDAGIIEGTATERHEPSAVSIMPKKKASKSAPSEAATATADPVDRGALAAHAPADDNTGELSTDGERAFVVKKASALNLDLVDLLHSVGATSIDTLTKTQFAAAKKLISEAAR